MTALARLVEERGLVGKIDEELANLQTLDQLAVEEEDAELSAEVASAATELQGQLVELEKHLWFTGELDDKDAIVVIHAGAGGTESQDWAEMLLRMYLRWAEAHGFPATLNEVSVEEEAGIKSATATIKGSFVYGMLLSEKGVHRLVRISPFDASGRRHTTFASVDVAPLVEEDLDVTLDPKDLRIETYRSSGAGGQHVNVTDSAVRAIHVPTGLVAQCQNERSQLQNKATALKILRSRLYELQMEQREAKLAVQRSEKKDIAWGSQIRSYVLQPYTMVKDHRTGFEKGNAKAVLDGDIDDFIEAFQRRRLSLRRGQV